MHTCIPMSPSGETCFSVSPSGETYSPYPLKTPCLSWQTSQQESCLHNRVLNTYSTQISLLRTFRLKVINNACCCEQVSDNGLSPNLAIHPKQINGVHGYE